MSCPFIWLQFNRVSSAAAMAWQIDITGPLFIFLISLGRNFTLRKWRTRIFSAVSNDGKCWLRILSRILKVQNYYIRGNVGCNSSRLLIDERDSSAAF